MSMRGGLNEMVRAQMGQYEASVITDTNAVSGTWWGVLVLADAVFATGTTFCGSTNPFGTTSVSAGVPIIPGVWTDIELVSGAVAAFKYV